MGMLDDIAGLIERNGLGTTGQNLFLARMPDSPDDAIAIYEYGGRAPQMTHGPVVMFENRSIQVVARSRNYASASAKIEQVANALTGIRNATIGEGNYLRIMPLQSPFPIGVDVNDRHQMVVNFEVAKQT